MSKLKKQLDSLFERGVNYTYFFNEIKSIKWLPLLIEDGYYKNLLPAEKKDGHIRFLPWAPMEYLIKIADQEPDKVMDVILSMPPTDNMAIYSQCIKAVLRMPPKTAVRINKRLKKWLAQPYLHLLPYELSDLLEFYIKHNELDSALDLAKELLRLKPPSQPETLLINHPDPIVGIHTFEELLDKQVKDLFNKRPLGVMELIIAKLRFGLGIEGRDKRDKLGRVNDYSDIWLGNFDTPHISVDANSKLALSIYQYSKDMPHSSSDFKAIVTMLMKEEAKIFHRLAAALIGDKEKDQTLKKLYDTSVKMWGKPIGTNTVFTSWTGPETPLSSGELESKAVNEIVSYISNWEPTGDIMAPSKEGLARSLSSLVEKKPDKGIEILSRHNDFPSIYSSHILGGLRITNDNNKNVDWEALIPVIDSVVSVPFDPKNENDNWLLTSALHLVESGLNHDQVLLRSKETRRTIIKLISKGLLSNDPSSGHNGMDPDTLSINSTRGMAINLLMSYLKALSRQSKSNSPFDTLSKKETDELTLILDTYVDPDNEKSAAVRAGFLREVAFLFYAIPNWVRKNESKLFPKDKVSFAASVESAILRSRPFPEVLPIIRPPLIRYLTMLKLGVIKLKDDFAESQLVAHIMIYALRGDIALDDELLAAFYNLDNKYLAQAVEYIGRNLRDLDPTKDKVIFTNARKYWELRLPKITKEEATDFGWWFTAEGLPLKWRVENLVAALHKSSEVEGLWLVYEWMQKNVDTEPKVTARLLLKIINTQSDEKLRLLFYKDIKEVLQKLYSNKDLVIKKQAEDIVDKLLSKGYMDFKDLLKEES